MGFLCPAATITEAEEYLDSIKKEHPTATHHCYAYLLNPNEPIEYSSDDGEPNGTAGLPILNTLKSHNLMNVILIVVRYYGGTKLGKAGLIDAYQTSAQQSIESATLNTLVPIKTYELEYDYPQQSLIEKWKNEFTWIDLESSYLETVNLKIGCPKGENELFKRSLKSKEHQLIRFEITGESFHIKN
ncbi:YigZ family protein [Rhodohalobacter sp. WB101]|uniref:YigZ family protein n=1 Tax=Rhodohalobacter sulfatireducens TaxID=2911366 RepID=A0ABS9KI70_9BACT|nr:YigZ family protein [Rhodohalobacter sulfatireducens]